MEEENEIVLNPPNARETTRELRDIPAAQRLNGKNYLKWSQVVKAFLKGRGLLNHIIGPAGPNEEDPGFEAWDNEDSMIKTWLWCSMEHEINDSLMLLNTAREVWEYVERSYSQVNDVAQIYEIKAKIMATKQGNKTINELAGSLQGLWQQLDYLQVIQMETAADTANLKRLFEKDRIFVFLASLNPEYDSVRSQILGKENLPSLNGTIATVRAEESRRNVMLDTSNDASSALFVKNSKAWTPKDKKETVAPTKPTDRDSLYCSYCKKKRHTRENCWKLNGRENNHGEKRYANTVSNNNDGPSVPPSASLLGFEASELEKLKKLLQSMDESTCSLAFSGANSEEENWGC